MATLRLFKSHAKVMGYVFKDGKTIHFINHEYATSIPKEIEELTVDCQDPTSNYYIDEKEREVDSAARDPIAVLRAKLRAEILAEVAAASSPFNDRGNTEQVPGTLQGISNSHSIAGLQVASGTAVPMVGAVPKGSINVAAMAAGIPADLVSTVASN